MRLRCDVLSYLNWRDHYVRRMAVRAHQRDRELADTLTMLRSRVGYTQHKFYQAVSLFSSTRWSEAARSQSPLTPRDRSCTQVRLLRLLVTRLAALGPDTSFQRGERATGDTIASRPQRSWPPPHSPSSLPFDHHPGDSRFNLGERTRMRRAGVKAKAARRFSVAGGVAVAAPPPEGSSCGTAACCVAAESRETGTAAAESSIELSLEA